MFQPERWWTYAAANLLVAFTYALIGALLAPLFGRVGGVFIAFLLPFLDLGITQSPMLHSTPTTLSTFLPGYGGSRVLLDGALTQSFDETRPLVIGLGWLVALLVLVVLAYRHSTASSDHAVGRTPARSKPAGAPQHVPPHYPLAQGTRPAVTGIAVGAGSGPRRTAVHQ